jgi:two-component system sensor histidine kinase/response regulator
MEATSDFLLDSPALKGARILIAEDEAVTRTMLEDMLRAEGFVTLLARDGAEALRMVGEEEVDLLLLDVMMPLHDGFEVCRRAKDEARLRGRFLPVLFLTALTQREARLQGLALGADDYLTKPFHRAEVLLRVRGLLSTKFLYDEIIRRYQALERLEQMQRRLASFIVHDFKNPLTGLLANLQLLEREMGADVSDKARGFLQDARLSAKRLFEMVGTLLDVYRMEEGALPLHREPLDLRQVFEEAVQDFEALARFKELRLEIQIADNLPPCQADRSLVVRILGNLVANAVRHSPRHKQILLDARLEASGERLLLSVVDEGTPIPPEHRSIIFQKFGRIEVPGGGSGHGLGLTFCRLAAESHGGEIYVEDSATGGNRFVVALPLQP